MRSIDKLNSIILDDMDYYKANGDTHIHKILEVIIVLVRESETPDYHIPDINAMVGYYLDEAEFYNKDYQKLKDDFFELYKKYMDYCFILNEMVIYNNFEKLKEYNGDDAIFVK